MSSRQRPGTRSLRKRLKKGKKEKCPSWISHSRENAEALASTFNDPSMIDPNRGVCTCACYITQSQMAAGHNGNYD